MPPGAIWKRIEQPMTLIHISLWINETKSRERRAKGHMLVSLKVYEHCECAPKNTYTFLQVHSPPRAHEWMMNLYSALLCIVIYPKRFTIMWGGVFPQPPRVCSIHLNDATYATGQRRQYAHHTPATGGEERVIEPNKWMHSPHTSYRWRGERVIEPNKWMRSPHTSYRWRGERVIETIKLMRSPHTSYRWRGERVIEPNKWMHSPHTSYRWRGERVIEPNKWMGIIRRPWLTRASGGNLARTHGSTSHNSVLLWFEWWV